MRRAVALLSLCGCDRIYGIGTAGQSDPGHEFFDAPIDAPFACTAVGTTPKFSPLLHQVIAQDCMGYTTSVSANLGMALCRDANYNQPPAQGPIDMMMGPAVGLDDPAFELQKLWLAPEGDEVLGQYLSLTGTGYEYRIYSRQADGSWTRGPDLLTSASYVVVSGFTRGPQRHVLVSAPDFTLHELERDAPNSWRDVVTHTNAELGIIGLYSTPVLAADGLHMIIYATPPGDSQARMMYTDRAALGDPFRTAAVLESVPALLDAYMPEDCSRIYFSAVQQILFIQRT